MKRLLLAVPLALALAAAGARAQAPNQPENGSPERAYSLDDALHLVRNDPRLQSSEQDVIIAESRVTEAELRFLPELGLQASASKFNALYPFALFRELPQHPALPEHPAEHLLGPRLLQPAHLRRASARSTPIASRSPRRSRP